MKEICNFNFEFWSFNCFRVTVYASVSFPSFSELLLRSLKFLNYFIRKTN